MAMITSIDITNYLIYTLSEERGWEMVPVEGIIQQLKVMSRVTFGRAAT